MKKVLLILGIILTAGLSVYAQNLTLTKGLTNISNGDTITTVGDATTTLTCLIDVTNNAAVSLSVKCLRTDIDVVPGSTNSICWGGSCWPVNVSLSPDPTVIAAGAKSTEFSGDYKANGNSGVSIIRYRFFNMNAIADSVCFYAKFDATVGINESSSDAEISDAYPNPANSYTNIIYKLTGGYNSANIIISNLLGKEVISIPVNEKEGKIRIETEMLTDGIYFYSFVLKDKIVYTKKLIVRH
jgi:hypothetical protein